MDRSGENRAILLQASSGMYLLPFENASPDYREKLLQFLQRSGVRVDLEALPPTDTTDKPMEVGMTAAEGSEVEGKRRWLVMKLLFHQLRAKVMRRGSGGEERRVDRVEGLANMRLWSYIKQLTRLAGTSQDQ